MDGSMDVMGGIGGGYVDETAGAKGKGGKGGPSVACIRSVEGAEDKVVA